MSSRDQKKAVTRRKLLDAAAALIAKNGVEATSLDDIAERAGLTKGAVYSNFASKDELIWALGERLPTIDFAEVFDAKASLGDNFARIGELLVAELSRTSERSWLLGLELTRYAMRNPKMRRQLVAEQRDNQSYAGRAFEEIAEAHGTTLPLPAGQLELVVDALAFGLGQKRAVDPKSVPDDLFPRAFRLLAGDA